MKLSTRSPEKQTALQQSGLHSYLVDIESPNSVDLEFLEADTLIINITNKNIAAFEKLINHIDHASIRHVLFISSTSVYQNTNDIVIEDNDLENLASPLYQIEQLFQQSTHFHTTILRFSGLIGPKRHPGRFFRYGKTVQQADAPVNLIHLDDCISMIDAIIEQQAWGQVFNGCADTHPNKREFYSHAAKQLNMPAPTFSSETTSSFKIVSNNKIKQLLNYQLVHPDLMALHLKDYE